jgi:hypothetical protein
LTSVLSVVSAPHRVDDAEQADAGHEEEENEEERHLERETKRGERRTSDSVRRHVGELRER